MSPGRNAHIFTETDIRCYSLCELIQIIGSSFKNMGKCPCAPQYMQSPPTMDFGEATMGEEATGGTARISGMEGTAAQLKALVEANGQFCQLVQAGWQIMR